MKTTTDIYIYERESERWTFRFWISEGHRKSNNNSWKRISFLLEKTFWNEDHYLKLFLSRIIYILIVTCYYCCIIMLKPNVGCTLDIISVSKLTEGSSTVTILLFWFVTEEQLLEYHFFHVCLLQASKQCSVVNDAFAHSYVKTKRGHPWAADRRQEQGIERIEEKRERGKWKWKLYWVKK